MFQYLLCIQQDNKLKYIHKYICIVYIMILLLKKMVMLQLLMNNIWSNCFGTYSGCYDKVVPFDFSSLYPTTIIANNIDYSTLVRDERIPDEDCNVIEWEDQLVVNMIQHHVLQSNICFLCSS